MYGAALAHAAMIRSGGQAWRMNGTSRHYTHIEAQAHRAAAESVAALVEGARETGS